MEVVQVPSIGGSTRLLLELLLGFSQELGWEAHPSMWKGSAAPLTCLHSGVE